MRIYEGNFAYEVEPVIDRATQTSAGWRYRIYRVRPVEQPLQEGQAPNRESAETEARKALAEVLKSERQGRNIEQAA